MAGSSVTAPLFLQEHMLSAQARALQNRQPVCASCSSSPPGKKGRPHPGKAARAKKRAEKEQHAEQKSSAEAEAQTNVTVWPSASETRLTRKGREPKEVATPFWSITSSSVLSREAVSSKAEAAAANGSKTPQQMPGHSRRTSPEQPTELRSSLREAGNLDRQVCSPPHTELGYAAIDPSCASTSWDIPAHAFL